MKVTVKPDESPKYSNKYPYFGALEGKSRAVVLFTGPNEGTKVGSLDGSFKDTGVEIGIYSRHWAEAEFARIPSGTISWSEE